MDEAGIEAKGLAPLKPQLEAIDALKTKAEFPALLARLHANGVPALFRFGARPDLRDSTINLAGVDQGGLALPDRDYYLSEEARFVELRKRYPAHVQRIFELLGESQERAARDAQAVLALETALAKASIDRVSRRDPANRDHKMTRAELAALAKYFDWAAYFSAAKAPSFERLNVGWPDFFKGVDALLETASLEDWKTYLRWQTLHQAAPLLPSAYVDATYDFFEKTLTGTKEIRPRWMRCVERTDRQLPEALGRRYAEAAFGPEAKARTAKMVTALEAALERDIRDLPWMIEATKKKALEKLAAITNKIGHPEKWRDYSRLAVVRGEALANAQRAAAFETARTRNGANLSPKSAPDAPC